MLSKISVALFAALVAVAVYAGGTANMMLSFGETAAPPPMNLITLTNRTIGNNTNNQATLSLDNDFVMGCGCGGMLEYLQGGGSFVAVNDEYLLDWQSNTYASCVGQDYEIMWNQVSGTLETAPSDDVGNILPEDTWSFAEWASAFSLCDLRGWFGGIWLGPLFGQGGAAANTTIEVSIRRIDLTDGPVTATFTFTP